MAKPKKFASEPALNYEAKLWQMADALRNNMDAVDYKHVVLGGILLKYISDAPATPSLADWNLAK